MRRSAKIKVAIARVPLRKATTAAVVPVVAVPRRAFPAWIDANDRGAAVAPAAVSTRVRDGLVLRVVRQTKSTPAKTSAHGSGAR